MKKLLMAALSASALQTAAAAGIVAEEPWARPTVAGMTVGGVFVSVKNETGRDDVLLGAASPAAAKTEIHNHINDKGVMRMREVKGGIALAAGKTVELKPGGYHIMLMGLKQPLQQGGKFPLTLKFKHARPQTVTVEVKAANGGHGHHHHHGETEPHSH